MLAAQPTGLIGFIDPALTDVSFCFLLAAAAIGIVRVARHRNEFTPSVVLAFAMWTAATAYLTMHPGHSGRLNLVPFNYGVAASPFEPVSNVLLFIPLGILLASLAWRWFAVLALGLGLSLVIETTQYLLNQGRTADVDDVIENTLGALIGWAVVLVVHRVEARRRRSRSLGRGANPS